MRRHGQPQKRAFLLLAVRAGSVLEDDDQRGLAHFVEHMAFNGTRRFEKDELVHFFERSGLQFGADANAFTGVDRTLYMLQVPTDDAGLLSTGFDVLEDWASALTFDPGQVREERLVILAEWLRGRGVQQRLQTQVQAFLLPGSRYVERSPIGEKAVIESAPLERLVSFYRDWYRPANMAVIAVGDLDPDATLAAITRRFGPLRATTPERARPLSAFQPVAATRVKVITDAEAQSPIVSVTFRTATRPYRAVSDERRKLLEWLLASMVNQRLSALCKQSGSAFLSAAGGVVRLSPEVDAYQVQALARTGQTDAALSALLIELTRVRRHGFGPGELERTKLDIARQRQRAVAAASTSPSRDFAFRIAQSFVQQDALVGPEAERELALALLGEIQLADVNRAAADWLSLADRSILVIGPVRDVLPPVEELRASVEAVENLEILPHLDRIGELLLVEAEPTPGRIVREEQITEIGVSVWTLSNGARVVLKPTDFKDDELLAQSVSAGGSSLAADADYAAASLASSIVLQSGVGSHDAATLTQLLSGKIVGVVPWISEHEAGLRGSASAEDAGTLLQLMHLYLTAPRRDEPAFLALKGQQRQAAQNRDLTPALVFMDAMSRELYGNHPRRQALSADMIDALDLDAALSFYRERLGDVGASTFVFVGRIDPASFRSWVERYLASVPGSTRAETWRDVGAYLARGREQVRVRSGQEPKSQVGLIFHGDAEWSAEAEDDLRMLRGYLDTRLREVIRKDKGGTYGVSVRAGLTRRPRPEYMVSIDFDCPPERADELKKAVFEVIDQLQAAGVSDDSENKIKELRRRQQETAFRDNGFWLEALLDHYRFGTDPRAILERKASAERVSSAALQRIARRYLDTRQYVDALLSPATDPSLV
jgi:zinc protease